MFENLPFAEIIQPKLEIMRLAVSIIVIILIIVTLTSGTVSGPTSYFYLITAIIASITSVVVNQLYKH